MQTSNLLKLLTALYLQWSFIKIDEPLISLWQKCFEGENEKLFAEAIFATLKTPHGKTPPTIAHVQETLEKIKSKDVNEGEAWQICRLAVSRYGFYRQVEGMAYLEEKSCAIAQAARSLGWENLCKMNAENDGVNRAHFWKALKGVTDEKKFIAALPAGGEARKLLEGVTQKIKLIA